MINPVELFVGLRYLRAKRRTRFVSFITFISLIGVALGVAALIAIVSAMNGMEADLRDRLLSMSSHGYVTGSDGVVDDWRETRELVAAEAGVAAAAPLVSMEGMVQFDGRLKPVIINGINPEYEVELFDGRLDLVEGTLDTVADGSRGIILGALLAYDLGAHMGDPITLLIPRPVGDGTMEPVLERFIMTGVFEVGMPDHDAVLALVNYREAAGILALDNAVTAVRFRADDVMQAPTVAGALRDKLGDVEVTDWTVENASFFRAIRLEKTMMAVLLSLIIGVAAFNIVASLVMVVTDKTSDIAVLRTLGMSANGVVRVFFVQGAMIGWLGVGIGIVLGVILAIYLPVIVPFVEQLFNFQILPGDVYYNSRIPSELQWWQVGVISVVAFFLTSLATLYPSRRAALVDPAAALRYE